MKSRHILSSLLVVLFIIMIGSVPVAAIPLGPVLYDRVNFCNKPAVNPGDPAYSEMFDGQMTLGWGCQQITGNILADQFTLAAPARLSMVELFAYQTNSSTTSTFDGAYVAIYNGNPMSGGTLVWGDMTTNRFVSTGYTGCYRVLYGATDTSRPIMKIIASADAELPAGTYYIAYALTGSLGSGPWGVPSVLETASTAGTGLQYIGSSSEWTIPVDSGTDIQPSFPFLIRGLAKESQTAPAAPVVAGKTDVSITLQTVTGAEYKRDDGAWQATPEFTGLAPYTEYAFYCRLAETATLAASPSSTATLARTDKSTVAAPAAPVLAGKTDSTLTLETVAGAEYRLDGGTWQASPEFTSLAPYSEHSLDIRLAETATAYASPASPAISARTSKMTITAIPPTPVMLAVTPNSVTLQAVDGAEYRVNDGPWQSSPFFTDLLPNTTYAITQRLAETEIALASPDSEALYSITLQEVSLSDLPQTGEQAPVLPLAMIALALATAVGTRIRLARRSTL